MSFLYPLFFAGIAAIAVPIILHMIRRHTRKRITFSSLLFLRTTVPRFRNRSRIEDILLLVLRCMILALLAIAFSRPFFRKEIDNSVVDNPGRRVVILIDTSASMRRTGLWDRAVSEAQAAINGIKPADRLCVMSFDKDARAVIGFESWGQMEPQLRMSSVKTALSGLTPGWESTNLGNALIGAAEAIEDDEVNIQAPIAKRQIVLISDLQQGSNIDALKGYEWPEGMELTVKAIRPPDSSNASMQYLTKKDYMLRTADSNESISVRVINSPDATAEHFQLSWVTEDSVNLLKKPIDVYVPAGHSIVTQLPSGPNEVKAGRLILTGDSQDFDNTLYIAPNLRQQTNILCITNDRPGNSGQMLYYLQRAFQQTNIFSPHIVVRSAEDAISNADIATAQLVIITDTIKPQLLESLRSQLQAGNTILLVMKSADAGQTMAALAGLANVNAGEAGVKDYVMLAKIEFTHPLLAIFSEPRFRDFSKIHFWKYRRINADDFPAVRVLARFDNDDPALFELPVGKGTLIVLTSGWQPSDSQLALSSKFVPLCYSLIEYDSAINTGQLQYFVGDSIRIPQMITAGTKEILIRSPDGTQTKPDSGQQLFSGAKQPGIYSILTPEPNQFFAVNIPLQESQTSPLALDELEQLGVSFNNNLPSVDSGQRKQTKQLSTFIEMENNQKIWRWVFAAIFAVLILETLLAGWSTRPAKTIQEQSND
jgi:hypothetical protein